MFNDLKRISEIKKGLTQVSVADELNIDRSTFNLKINRSKGRDFTFGEAIKISEIIGFVVKKSTDQEVIV